MLLPRQCSSQNDEGARGAREQELNAMARATAAANSEGCRDNHDATAFQEFFEPKRPTVKTVSFAVRPRSASDERQITPSGRVRATARRMARA